MIFETPLISGTLIKRYKRFLADIQLDSGEIITAHCPNSGRMTNCGEEGSPVLIRHVDDPKRKLKYTWELVQAQGRWVCINTVRANQVAGEALRAGLISDLAHFTEVQAEFKHGASRIDFRLANETEKCLVEVKSVSLINGTKASFPDAPTARGLKHLNELAQAKEDGWRTVMLYIIMCDGVTHFSPAKEVDPAYAKRLAEVHDLGVEILVYDTKLNEISIEINEPVSWSLN